VATFAYGALIPAAWCAWIALRSARPSHLEGEAGDLRLGMLLSEERLLITVTPMVVAIAGVVAALSGGAQRVGQGIVVRVALGLGVLSGLGWCVIALISEEAMLLVVFGWALAAFAAYELFVGGRTTLASRVAAALPARRGRSRRSRRERADVQWMRACVVFLVLVLLVPLAANDPVFLLVFVAPPLLAWYSAAPITLGIACAVLLRDTQRARTPERPALGGRDLSWLALLAPMAAAAVAGWRHAVQSAIERYAELPPPPEGDCYVATAASRGHARFVGARELAVRGGVRRVTEQLLTLKAGELTLKAAAPELHRALRRAYDRVGPPVARRITTPWRADLAYLTLVPFAVTTRLVLALLCARPSRLLPPPGRGPRRVT